MIKTSKLEFL